MSGPIIVLGIGDDGLPGLSASARALLDQATFIAGGPRHLEMLGADDPRERLAWSKDLSGDIEKLAAAHDQHQICVLASGDPLMHGIAVRLIERFGRADISVHPAPSAFSLAASRMGWSLSDPMLSCVSVHAQPFETLHRYIQPGVRLLILSRDGETPQKIAETLCQRGYTTSPVTVLEHLGGVDEARHDTTTADGLRPRYDNLNTVCVDCIADKDALACSNVPGLPDDAFDHDGTITKSEVRAVTLAALAPMPGEVLWDIGAGNGTVAIEWLRAEPRAHAIGIERDLARATRARANAAKLGVPGLQIIEGDFPLADDKTLPAPDAIFIGGGIVGEGDVLIHAINALKSGGRLVANAVTLEAQADLMTAQKTYGGDFVKIGISRSAPVGPHLGLKAAIDVLQWRMKKT